MNGIAYALFDTPIGRCGIAWDERGIAALQLPEADDARTCRRMLRRLPDAREEAAPPWVLEVEAHIVALLRGAAIELTDVALDMERIPAFDRQVYDLARAIGPGLTLTYGELAERLKEAKVEEPSVAQAVGAALGRNPFAIIVPCHRVIGANGKTGGFSAHGGPATKRQLLEIESALLRGTLFE